MAAGIPGKAPRIKPSSKITPFTVMSFSIRKAGGE
jgi:hypothetical protein